VAREPLFRFAVAMILNALIFGAQNTVLASVALLSALRWKYLWEGARFGLVANFEEGDIIPKHHGLEPDVLRVPWALRVGYTILLIGSLTAA